jgi:hypothetical protein
MSAKAYRRNTADCLKMSLAVADPEMRELLKRTVIAWTILAEQSENERPQSMVQQQQQPQLKGLDFDGLTPEEQRRACWTAETLCPTPGGAMPSTAAIGLQSSALSPHRCPIRRRAT